MIIFFDPANGQVMAIYSTDTTSTVWTDQGFVKARSDIRVTRDHRVVVENDKVVSATPRPNPEQPAASSDARFIELRGKLINQMIAGEVANPTDVTEFKQLRGDLGKA